MIDIYEKLIIMPLTFYQIVIVLVVITTSVLIYKTYTYFRNITYKNGFTEPFATLSGVKKVRFNKKVKVRKFNKKNNKYMDSTGNLRQ